MDEPSITECRRKEMEVSSKIEDKMDGMMIRIEQGMRVNDEANKSRCEAMQSSVNNRMESLCTVIEAKMTEVNDTISQVKKENQSELSKCDEKFTDRFTEMERRMTKIESQGKGSGRGRTEEVGKYQHAKTTYLMRRKQWQRDFMKTLKKKKKLSKYFVHRLM